MTELPDDIKQSWLPVIRRLQSVARSNMLEGGAIIHMNIFVDTDGNPQLWCEPDVTRIEPKRLANAQSLQEVSAILAREILVALNKKS
jgi:hypothetical protein